MLLLLLARIIVGLTLKASDGSVAGKLEALRASLSEAI